MIGGLGVGELSIILCIVVVLFGAGRLAGIGKGLGKGISNFKKEMDNDAPEQLEDGDVEWEEDVNGGQSADGRDKIAAKEENDKKLKTKKKKK